jgi:CheY-like chemotaxis protein
MESLYGLTTDKKTHSYQKPLVMVVDDNENNLLLMGYIVESTGCRLISQEGSSCVIAVAKEHRPDLIILDILMPGISGIDLVGILKQEPTTCMIPVIAVTALSGAEDYQDIISAGFDDCISKPYSIDTLEALLERYLYSDRIRNSA